MDQIIVFADSLDWQEYREGVYQYFSREYLTPVAEREYQVMWRPIDQFEQYKTYRNIMILARLDSEEKTSALVKQMLTPQAIDSIRSGRFYYPRSDVWARDQYVVYLVSPSRNDMIRQIYDLGELVYDDFEKFYYARLKEDMFRNYENKKLEDYLLRHFPFTLRVQHDYVLADESSSEQYVWLRRLTDNRDRSLLVHWIPFSDSIKISRDWVIRERNRLAAGVYEGDVVVENETTAQEVRFYHRIALRLEGTWMNPGKLVGGPFRNITFIDRKSNLIFMIDFYVQAIGERKKLFLDQLDVMAHTFRSKYYIEEEARSSD